MTSKFPSLKWLKSELRNNLVVQFRKPIFGAYIVGSVAKGTASPESDLDIAVIISPVRGKTSLRYTETYHSEFSSNELKPKWENRVVDFQFFYPNDSELQKYDKIILK